jgi:hypothetical protein
MRIVRLLIGAMPAVSLYKACRIGITDGKRIATWLRKRLARDIAVAVKSKPKNAIGVNIASAIRKLKPRISAIKITQILNSRDLIFVRNF